MDFNLMQSNIGNESIFKSERPNYEVSLSTNDEVSNNDSYNFKDILDDFSIDPESKVTDDSSIHDQTFKNLFISLKNKKELTFNKLQKRQEQPIRNAQLEQQTKSKLEKLNITFSFISSSFFEKENKLNNISTKIENSQVNKEVKVNFSKNSLDISKYGYSPEFLKLKKNSSSSNNNKIDKSVKGSLSLVISGDKINTKITSKIEKESSNFDIEIYKSPKTDKNNNIKYISLNSSKLLENVDNKHSVMSSLNSSKILDNKSDKSFTISSIPKDVYSSNIIELKPDLISYKSKNGENIKPKINLENYYSSNQNLDIEILLQLPTLNNKSNIANNLEAKLFNINTQENVNYDYMSNESKDLESKSINQDITQTSDSNQIDVKNNSQLKDNNPKISENLNTFFDKQIYSENNGLDQVSILPQPEINLPEVNNLELIVDKPKVSKNQNSSFNKIDISLKNNELPQPKIDLESNYSDNQNLYIEVPLPLSTLNNKSNIANKLEDKLSNINIQENVNPNYINNESKDLESKSINQDITQTLDDQFDVKKDNNDISLYLVNKFLHNIKPFNKIDTSQAILKSLNNNNQFLVNALKTNLNSESKITNNNFMENILGKNDFNYSIVGVNLSIKDSVLGKRVNDLSPKIENLNLKLNKNNLKDEKVNSFIIHKSIKGLINPDSGNLHNNSSIQLPSLEIKENLENPSTPSSKAIKSDSKPSYKKEETLNDLSVRLLEKLGNLKNTPDIKNTNVEPNNPELEISNLPSNDTIQESNLSNKLISKESNSKSSKDFKLDNNLPKSNDKGYLASKSLFVFSNTISNKNSSVTLKGENKNNNNFKNDDNKAIESFKSNLKTLKNLNQLNNKTDPSKSKLFEREIHSYISKNSGTNLFFGEIKVLLNNKTSKSVILGDRTVTKDIFINSQDNNVNAISKLIVKKTNTQQINKNVSIEPKIVSSKGNISYFHSEKSVSQVVKNIFSKNIDKLPIIVDNSDLGKIFNSSLKTIPNIILPENIIDLLRNKKEVVVITENNLTNIQVIDLKQPLETKLQIFSKTNNKSDTKLNNYDSNQEVLDNFNPQSLIKSSGKVKKEVLEQPEDISNLDNQKSQSTIIKELINTQIFAPNFLKPFITKNNNEPSTDNKKLFNSFSEKIISEFPEIDIINMSYDKDYYPEDINIINKSDYIKDFSKSKAFENKYLIQDEKTELKGKSFNDKPMKYSEDTSPTNDTDNKYKTEISNLSLANSSVLTIINAINSGVPVRVSQIPEIVNEISRTIKIEKPLVLNISLNPFNLGEMNMTFTLSEGNKMSIMFETSTLAAHKVVESYFNSIRNIVSENSLVIQEMSSTYLSDSKPITRKDRSNNNSSSNGGESSDSGSDAPQQTRRRKKKGKYDDKEELKVDI